MGMETPARSVGVVRPHGVTRTGDPVRTSRPLVAGEARGAPAWSPAGATLGHWGVPDPTPPPSGSSAPEGAGPAVLPDDQWRWASEHLPIACVDVLPVVRARDGRI